MPWRHKNKSHACGRCHQVRGDTQEAQASAAEAPKEECPSSPSSAPQGSPLSSPAGDHQELQGAMAPSSPDARPSCAASDEGVQGPEEESAGASQEAPATQSTRKDPLARKARILVEFLLEKYTKKEPIMQSALMKIVSRNYRQHFSDILSTARERVELVFGLEMKEVDHRGNIYTVISKVNLGANDCPSDGGVASKSGLIIVLLGVMFMNGNRATEEEIWEFLSMLGIYAGRRHWIFGEPRRLITKDLVQKVYLNYHRVPNSDPPRYEFLLGPIACAETSKMKVLEVLAMFHGRVPSSFPDLYDEALRDQAERAGRRGVARAPTVAEASAPSRAKSCSSSHI
ncbi:melanoma-associated antigen B4-like [Bos indicus]|uniref:Melanoma-associated antigen B4-like n=1 Tax=Bos indicus TaxID=9915 RepID=A0ABM4S076_BOSIN|nr:melanoma-associated antigen B4-like [Bos indicus x Bos taurus]